MEIFGYRITVSKIKRKKKKGFSAKAWSEADTKTLIEMQGENYSHKDMGKELGRTIGAIKTRLSIIKNSKQQRIDYER